MPLRPYSLYKSHHERKKSLLSRVVEFHDSSFYHYAAALSFYTLFSLIPLMMVGLFVFSAFGEFGQYLESIKTYILSNIIPTQTNKAMDIIDVFLENSSKLGWMGLFYIFFASVIFFLNFQEIASSIFKTKERPFWKLVSIYWTLVSLLPIIVVLILLTIAEAQERLDSSIGFSTNISSLMPYFLNWLLFFVLFHISANKKILFRANFISSFWASLIWSLGKYLYIYYAINVANYNIIYGSFSILLFFLLWVYISWLIVLYGMKLCNELNGHFAKNSSPKSLFRF